jgi:hypothetical protein
MPKSHYLPKSDTGKLSWLDNLRQKLTIYAVLLGILPAEVTTVTDDYNMFAWILSVLGVFKSRTKDITAYKDQLRFGKQPIGDPPGLPTITAPPTTVESGIFTRIGQLVQRIKNHPNYNDAIGEDLQIIGAEQTIIPEDMKPILKGAVDGVNAKIIWTKGEADSIDIYADRRDGKGFIYLANDSQPDYFDTTPLPDGINVVVWDYKGRYRIGDEQVGQFSEPISITITKKV